MRRTLVAAVAAVALAVPLLGMAAGGRHAQPVCGSTLTRDTVLVRDLTCTGDGLTLAPGVSLDLRGHTLAGSGSGTGIRVPAPGTNRVGHGTVRGWYAGIRNLEEGEWVDAGPLLVDKVTFRDNDWAVDASGQSGTGLYRKPTTVTRSRFVGNDVGVVAAWFSTVTVDRSWFTGNRIAVWSNAEATVRRSTFTRNETAITVYEGSVDVSHSVFDRNPRAVTVAGVGFAEVGTSSFVGGDVAVTADRWGTVALRHNVLVGSGTGVLVAGGDGVIESNVFRSNGVGLRYTESDWGTTTVRDNVLTRNGDGILADAGATLLELGGNAATRNTGWGIHAPDAVDLGGNTARLNGRSPQCVGVVCAP